jgi:hypothetical protein
MNKKSRLRRRAVYAAFVVAYVQEHVKQHGKLPATAHDLQVIVRMSKAHSNDVEAAWQANKMLEEKVKELEKR